MKDEILYVRVDAELKNALYLARDAERMSHPGRRVSLADLVREILYTSKRVSKHLL